VHSYLNPTYVLGHRSLIFPKKSSLLRGVHLWKGYWTRYAGPNATTRHLIPRNLTAWCEERREAIESAQILNSSKTDELKNNLIVSLQRELLRKERRIQELLAERGE
tara:strand:+ start:267 stop:587 length:321 start_codon:yes stop_codon:yes gene_type:complete